jgi:hypothetical protein
MHQPIRCVLCMDSTFFLSQGDMCVDTVVVVLSAGGSARGGSASGEEETHVLVPAVGVAWLSLVLGPELLEEDTHYTASLSLPPGHLSASSFSTYAVQSLAVTELAGGLRVECVFALGCSQDTCTVVVEGGGFEYVRNGLAMEFSLGPGSYTVRGYDGRPEEGGAAVEMEAEVSGPPPTPPDPPATDTTTTGADFTETVMASASPSINLPDGGRETFRTQVFAVSVGTALLCVVACTLVVVIICFVKFQRTQPLAPQASEVVYEDIKPLSTSSAITTEPMLPPPLLF